MSPDSQRNRLPFEPGKNRKKPAKPRPSEPAKQPTESNQPVTGEKGAIPEIVSRRMVRRMAFFCGIPSALGIVTMISSYFVVTQEWFVLPHIAVVLVSMGFFGLGVLGLSYGVLSASWDEEVVGSRLGWSEFTTNFGRMTEAWRSAKKKNG